MKVLVTGGLGYIGSHTAVELSKKYETIIADNLINSDISIHEGINKIAATKIKFERIDLTDSSSVKKLFDKYPDISSIIHFAALKAVGESVKDPIPYYYNNLCHPRPLPRLLPYWMHGHTAIWLHTYIQ